jgi:hypothetical protein
LQKDTLKKLRPLHVTQLTNGNDRSWIPCSWFPLLYSSPAVKICYPITTNQRFLCSCFSVWSGISIMNAPGSMLKSECQILSRTHRVRIWILTQLSEVSYANWSAICTQMRLLSLTHRCISLGWIL